MSHHSAPRYLGRARDPLVRSLTLAVVLPLLAASSSPVLHAQSGGARPPDGWQPAGSHPEYYVMEVDTSVQYQGLPSVRIASEVPAADVFGTLLQSISANDYRGKRVRLSGFLRTRDVSGGASLWLRVDGPCSALRAFDNAQNRAAQGTTDWQPEAIVLDVAADANALVFGTLLRGWGTVWVSGLRLDVVPSTISLTAESVAPTRGCGPAAPMNIDFSSHGTIK